MITLWLSEKDFDYELQALVNSFFPGQKSKTVWGAHEEQLPEEGLQIRIFLEQQKIRICLRSCGQERMEQADVSGLEDFHKKEGKLAHPYRSAYKNKLKRLLFCMLRDWPEENLPQGLRRRVPVWGTMTGVRPTKIPMNELLAGKSREEVKHSLRVEYQCSEKKADLCLDIAQREAALLQTAEYEQGYSLYIGIPFCPTTCLYCSFTSYPAEQFGRLIPGYLEALKRELEGCSNLPMNRGKHLSSIYIGGGTPTTLSAEQLRDLVECIRSYYPVGTAREFTVEAGRPDSITEEKLQALKEAGADRISINPQTMQQRTLELIGRRHTVEQTRQVFSMARQMGFDNINMDLIIGLPGETPEDFADTLRQLKELDPDGITIHSLVIKRASRLRRVIEECGREERKRLHLAPEDFEREWAKWMEHMLELGDIFARENGYLPYYMYRQKNSGGYGGSSGQENIGYAREGKEGLYNILIMEEKQTILALGAGASTKVYDPERNLVTRIENVKSITDYIDRIQEMLGRKKNGGLYGKPDRGVCKG